ncbi:sensor histidine kinase [Bittarella sp. HCP28S3_D9]|uniref:sensor histidine kinase n=1 Tax=Bittarella sp. HCP28S3_D9 TaxID=3440253 RepID=UPI003F8C30B1
MKRFSRLFFAVALGLAALILGVNLVFLLPAREGGGGARPHQVEISRLARAIAAGGEGAIDLTDCRYVTRVTPLLSGEDAAAFFAGENLDAAVRQIGGTCYRFDYRLPTGGDSTLFWAANGGMIAMAVLVLSLLFVVWRLVLQPFEQLRELPFELAKGNLSSPLPESRGRLFGRFLWGLDLLREELERRRAAELSLQREKKSLLLSLSHDIKTPLSAIKLYAKALRQDLYGPERRGEIAGRIGQKADEIESFVSQLVTASSENLLQLEVCSGEFYLRQLVGALTAYYPDKLALQKTDFRVGPWSDCLLKGDLDRAVEVAQNLLENAIKYGDGGWVALSFGWEEDCLLLTVKNSGSPPPEGELPYLFDSFWRGSNAADQPGSGLGLAICRQLMAKMDGELFAQAGEGEMAFTVVFRKPGG